MGLPEVPKSRIAAFDVAKGVAIILVVYGHCLRGLLAGGMIEPQTPLLVSDYAIYTFHMPLFFAISGYFLDRSSRKSPGTVWRGRIRAIAYPYFLWSLLHGGLLYAVSGSGMANNDMRFSRLLEIGWNPISPYWFLYTLFFTYVLASLLRRLPSEWMAALALAAFLGLFATGPSVFLDIAYGFFYFGIGVLVRERGLVTRLPSSLPSVLLLWLGFAAVTGASYVIGVPERLPLASAFLGILALFSTCLYLDRHHPDAVPTRVLELLGQCSMGIFVMHIIVLAAVRIVLLRVLHVADPAILLSIGTVFALLLPVVVQLLAIGMGIQNLLGLPSSAKPGFARAAAPLAPGAQRPS